MTNSDFISYDFHHIAKDSKGKQLKSTAKIHEMPKWKQHFIEKNRAFYIKHKQVLDKWIKRYDMLNQTLNYKKFEWNCNSHEIFDYTDTIIQFRQSGIRVKPNNYFPTLGAINNTPIIYDKKNQIFRKISPREAANLQSF